jgi:hypothetical protein
VRFGTKGAALAAVLAVGLLAACGSSKSSSSSSSTGPPATSSASAYRQQLDAASKTFAPVDHSFLKSLSLAENGKDIGAIFGAASTYKSATDTYASTLQALAPPSNAASAQGKVVSDLKQLSSDLDRLHGDTPQNLLTRLHESVQSATRKLIGDETKVSSDERTFGVDLVTLATAVGESRSSTTTSSHSTSTSTSGSTTANAAKPGVNCSGSSPASNQATSIIFVNSSNGLALVYWLSFTGRRVLYFRLPPHQQYRQQTYVSHKWVVYEAGRCTAATVATNRQTTFVIR